MVHSLGRLTPTDWKHYERFPLTIDTIPDDPVPIWLGINWYSAFDNPTFEQGRYWIGRNKRLGSIRGGHSLAVECGDKPNGKVQQDLNSWWKFYNQLNEGICVAEGGSRVLSLMNRKLYQPQWLYDQCKLIDGYDGVGTWVRYGLDVVRQKGHVLAKRGESHSFNSAKLKDRKPAFNEGITANRWARNVDQVHEALKSPYSDKLGAVRLLNSWGKNYPHRVWMPDDVLQRLIDEDGEVAIVTDR